MLLCKSPCPWRHAGFPQEKTREIGGVAEAKADGDHLHRRDREQQFLLGNIQLPLGDQSLKAHSELLPQKAVQMGLG